MSNWTNVIDLSREWENENIIEICKDAVSGLNKIKIPSEYETEKEELIEQFADLIDLECDELYEFNNVLNYLYDFGDTKLDNDFNGKTIAWIKTRF